MVPLRWDILHSRELCLTTRSGHLWVGLHCRHPRVLRDFHLWVRHRHHRDHVGRPTAEPLTWTRHHDRRRCPSRHPGKRQHKGFEISRRKQHLHTSELYSWEHRNALNTSAHAVTYCQVGSLTMVHTAFRTTLGLRLKWFGGTVQSESRQVNRVG